MKNELIPFKSENNNLYFYDPLLQEIFIHSNTFYRERELICKNSPEKKVNYNGLVAEDVEYQLANLGQITFEITEKCNLNCLYCTYGSLYSSICREGKDIPFGIVKNILVYLADKMNSTLNVSTGNPFYISFYGGEPLVRIDIVRQTVDFVKRLTFSNNNVTFSMTTNGYFLDKYMDYLQENKFRLLISLDGDELGNQLRADHQGNSQFQKIFRNIKALQSKYPDFFMTNVNFNAVLNKYNSVESITDFIEANFNKLPQISDISSRGLQPGKISEFYNIYSSSLKSFAEAGKVMNIKDKYFIHHPVVKESFIFLQSVCRNSFKDYNHLLFEGNSRKIPTGTCLPFFKRIFIAANGVVLPCENVSHKHSFGTVDEKGVHIDAGEIAEKYNQAFKQLADQCKQCHGQEICPHCVFQMEEAYKCTGIIKKADLEKKFSQALTLIEDNPELYARMMKEVCVE